MFAVLAAHRCHNGLDSALTVAAGIPYLKVFLMPGQPVRVFPVTAVALPAA